MFLFWRVRSLLLVVEGGLIPDNSNFQNWIERPVFVKKEPQPREQPQDVHLRLILPSEHFDPGKVFVPEKHKGRWREENLVLILPPLICDWSWKWIQGTRTICNALGRDSCTMQFPNQRRTRNYQKWTCEVKAAQCRGLRTVQCAG